MDKVVVLPSEAAQHLANHIFNIYGTISATWSYDGEQNLSCNDPQDLAKTIQDYWDSLL